MYIGLHVIYSLFLSDFSETPILWAYFGKIFNFMTVQWESSCSMRIDRRTDGQRDILKLTVTFCNFEKSPKMIFIYFVTISFNM